MTSHNSGVWATLSAVAVGSVLLSLVPLQQSHGGNMPCGSASAPACDGFCPVTNESCVPNPDNPDAGCVCQVVTGCCVVNAELHLCSNDVTAADCPGPFPFVPGGSCGGECVVPGPPPCGNATAPACEGSCHDNQSCVPNPDNPDAGCVCQVVTGCCVVNADLHLCSNDVTAADCPGPFPFVPGGSCGGECVIPGPPPCGNATAPACEGSCHDNQSCVPNPDNPDAGCVCKAPTNTPTPSTTPTNTAVPNGGGCDDRSDCLSGNCIDDTCCAQASCPPGQSCNNPGNAGTCSPDPTAPAPAISRGGVMLALSLLVAIGGFALLRRRRGAAT